MPKSVNRYASRHPCARLPSSSTVSKLKYPKKWGNDETFSIKYMEREARTRKRVHCSTLPAKKLFAEAAAHVRVIGWINSKSPYASADQRQWIQKETRPEKMPCPNEGTVANGEPRPETRYS